MSEEDKKTMDGLRKVGMVTGTTPGGAGGDALLGHASEFVKNDGAGTFWGPAQYGDPGKLELPKDASAMPSLVGSHGYDQLLQAMETNRGRTNAGTQSMLGDQADMDPYAASRENRQAGLEADLGHESYLGQQRMLAYRQNLALQQYLTDVDNYQREEDQRNAVWDKAGRTAYGGGQAILNFFTEGGFGKATGNKPATSQPTYDPNDRSAGAQAAGYAAGMGKAKAAAEAAGPSR